ALFRVELLRDLEDEPIARVAVTALAEVGHALALEFEDLAGLAAGRDPEFHRAVEHGDLDLGPERQLRECNGQVAVEVDAIAREDLVLADAHEAVEARRRLVDGVREPVLDVLAGRGAGASARSRATREEGLEDVFEQRPEARVREPPARRGTHRAEPVEVRALFGVGQDAVRLADLLE